jgi:hypothetical protein
MSAETARACAGHAARSTPGLYRPRHPERTVLHAVVGEHLETWLAAKRAGGLDTPAVAGFVERDFRQYLDGAPGAARARGGPEDA